MERPATIDSGAEFTYFLRLPLEIRRMIWRDALPGPRLVEISQRRLKKTISEWQFETRQKWPAMVNHDDNVNGDFEAWAEKVIAEKMKHSSPDVLVVKKRPLSWIVRFTSSNGFTENVCNRTERIRSCAQDELECANESYGYQRAKMVGIYCNTRQPQMLYVNKEAREVALKNYERVFSIAGSNAETYFDFSIDTLYIKSATFSPYFGYDGLDGIYDDFSIRFPVEDDESLKRVKRLAILVSEVEFPTSKEVAQLLRIFNKVEDLEIVLKHEKQWCLDADGDDSRDLERHSQVLIEPIDALNMLQRYREFYPKNCTESEHIYAQVPQFEVEYLPESIYPVDLNKLKERQLADLGEGKLWNLPRVRARCAVPLGMVKRLEQERLRCEKLLAEYKESMLE